MDYIVPKLQQSKSVLSCFTLSGIIETKLNYYLSNYFCKGQTLTSDSDIETLKFVKVKIILLYAVLGETSPLLIGIKKSPTT